ncbi:ap4a phosphorylase 2 [Colletotrichum plurivorum]|uniref:Ap4a phosphorylase 2 n=1 Tax=Colletotrichum plurivorum TaxID=2175906 RepID=A0A8H6U5F4_9PEZI|nr:ap4a phosphorylase 2 [Colletotrichum plurivorum]
MGSQANDEASVLARFDRLVEEGTVLYSPDLRKVHHTDGGFKFEFRLTSALKSKPAAVSDNAELDEEVSSQKHPPPPPAEQSKTAADDWLPLDEDGCIPGGDISVSGGFLLGPVNGGSHALVFNKFCAYRPHLMLLAADGRRRQFEALGRDDLSAAAAALDGLGEEYLAIFNCGRDAGCSRLHKHMQIFPAPGDFVLWPDDEASQPPPFRCFIKRFDDGKIPETGELAKVYGDMLRDAASLVPGREEVVEEDGDGREVAVPHNVVLCRRWMVVVPRTQAGVGGADANAAGMMGMVWASGEDVLERWMAFGPRRVLGEVGVRV